MKKIIILLLLVCPVLALRADEGMWLLSRLKQHNEAQMKKLGLKIPVEYVVDSLSQAIISYNGSGTASFISKDGLLLTNYHCAYAAIQQSSSDEHNYIRDGFWAMNQGEEIPLKGVDISINRVIKDISEEVNAKLVGVKPEYSTRFGVVNGIAEKYRKQFDCNWESMTRDFNFDQNLHRVICLDVRYLLFITEKYAHMNYIIAEILGK